MKTFIYIVVSSLLLVGCANEKYFSGNGFEALGYQEQHEFEFTVQDTEQFKQQLTTLVTTIASEDREAAYLIEYRTAQHKALISDIFKTSFSAKNRPVFELNRNQALASDIKMNVAIYRLSAQKCLPSDIRVDLNQPDCFVESMRLKQVAYKSRVVGE